jgi:hypothetical protein
MRPDEQQAPPPLLDERAARVVATTTGAEDYTTSAVEYAVRALGELLNLAFSDALRVDQLARKSVEAWGNIDAPERIELADRHPGLVEALLLLEDTYERIDRR